MPSTIFAPFLSVKRMSSLPTDVYLPDSSQREAGRTTGNDTSWPPRASISSRMISSIFLVMRFRGGRAVYIPLATYFI